MKKNIINQLHNSLREKISFGESKHEAKKDLKFGESSYKIFSYSTYNTYLKEIKQYSKWLLDVKNIDKYTRLDDTFIYAKEYIQYRLENDKVSVYTAKMERSALSMAYSRSIDIKMPTRDNKNITRSREETKNDKYISRDGKYKNVFDIALATGTRRCDIMKLTKESFFEKDNLLYVKILGSKGGRDRISPVRIDMTEQVKEILNSSVSGEKIFSKIPKEIDVHSLRREYARNLYDIITKNSDLKEKYLEMYPARNEDVKRDTYKDRAGNTYNRDDLYVISQALGHNRLEVTVTHYLK